MTAYPQFPDRLTLSLDGSWRFEFLGDASLETLDVSRLRLPEIAAVPGVFDATEPHHGRRGVAVYQRTVRVPFAGVRKMRLRIGALGLRGRVWWDGRAIGEVATPYIHADFDLDVDGGVTHTLCVAVDNRFDAERSPLFPPYTDFYAYGGIFRSVTLTELPATRIERIAVAPIDADAGKVRLSIRLGGAVSERVALRIQFDDAPAEQIDARPDRGIVVLERSVPDARPWSIDTPHLHHVAVAIEGDRIVERFGLRTVDTHAGRIRVNGQPIVIKGVNRHEAHPQFGPVQSVQSILNDLLQIKAMGCNFVRAVHYPHDPAVLDLCDEIGLLVWSESLAWGLDEKTLAAPEAQKQLLDQTRQMVREQINHPSVITWAFLNECASDSPACKPLYAQLVATIREEDATRLVSYASNRHTRDVCFDLVDVVAVNLYPGWIAPTNWEAPAVEQVRPYVEQTAIELPKTPGAAGKPILVTEIGACGIYGMHDRDRAQWTEEFQSDFMTAAATSVLDHPALAGVVLWQFCDTRSFVGSGQVRTKPRGFNYAGLVDEYRRPKLAYDAVARIFRVDPIAPAR